VRIRLTGLRRSSVADTPTRAVPNTAGGGRGGAGGRPLQDGGGPDRAAQAGAAGPAGRAAATTAGALLVSVFSFSLQCYKLPRGLATEVSLRSYHDKITLCRRIRREGREDSESDEEDSDDSDDSDEEEDPIQTEYKRLKNLIAVRQQTHQIEKRTYEENLVEYEEMRRRLKLVGSEATGDES